MAEVFHKGFNKGKDGPGGPKERPQNTKVPKSGKKETAQGRMIHNASKGLTAEKMRKPFG